MNNTQKYTIGDLVSLGIIYPPEDGNHGEIHPKSSDFTPFGIPFIMASDLKYGKVNYTSCKYIPKEKADCLRKGFSVNDDVLLTHKATIGETAVVSRIDYPYIMLTPQVTFYRIKDKTKLNNLYLRYYFQTKEFQKQLKLWSGAGSTRAYIGILEQLNLSVEILEDIDDQQKIAAVLSVLDSKIELNNKINTELEQMAKTLYDYWFVQFDFPDKNSKPYKTSGGKMVWSEELKREIPEGWEAKELNDIISKSGTGLNPRKNFKLGYGENYYITIRNVKNGKIIFDDTSDRIDDDALKIIDKRSDLQVGDILFTSIEPVGITYFIHEKPKNWNINESVFTIRPNYEKITSEYLYMLLSSAEMKAFTTNVSAGSIHKGVRHTVLKTFKLPYKDKIITDNFANIISPILKRIYLIDNENQKLAELRDWLLPMLMNGQVTVKS
ncbi:MAG: restriction endonuclease subunit S [Patescibacteria group bacterium]|nr:restriction endonuclease subunit S [Patescibacteria group bacterium]